MNIEPINVEQIEKRLIDWVLARLEGQEGVQIDAGSNLRDMGLIDSLGFIGLMALLEEMGAENVDNVLASPKDFASIRELVDECFKGKR